MNTLTVYSYCITVPDFSYNDTTLLRKQQHFLRRHNDLSQLTFQLDPSKNQLNIIIFGPTSSVFKARSDIFQSNIIQVRATIQSIHPHIIFNEINRLKLTTRLETIAMDLLVHIKVNIAHESSIIIQGPMTIVETARTQILIYLDQMLGLCIDSVKLPILVHNLLGGKRHYQLQSVMEETATNIYLGSPYVIGNMDIHEQQEAVYISGDIAETERATCLVKKLSEQKLNSLYHKEVTLDPRKLDWILLHQQDKLKKLLYDNGSFIHFPHIGAGIGTIQIYAENKINVERTLWLLNHMTYKICRATINVKQRQRSIRKNISSFIYKMANISGAEIMYHEDQDRLDIYGSEPSLRLIYQYFKDSPFTDYHLSTSISIELQAENRIFIQGKKYGKINKIIKSSGTNIKFLPSYNNSNCLVQVQSNDIDKVFHGLELLSQELPEERSFYVSEIYHRRIIGVGGKNIQRIMKKYGVYVKFSSTEEFIDHGGYFENEHNVFARTPRKYSGNLNQLYDEIMELITSENDQNWVSYTIMIPFYLHRVIPNQYSDSLRDYGRLHNTRLWWPPRSGIADVTVIGPIAHVHRIQIALSNLILHHDYLAIPASITLTNHLGSAITMGQLKQSIKLNWCVNIIELDPQLSEIKSTTRVKWETIQLFKNATIFLLTTTIDSSGHLPFSINDDPNFAYDCKYRLKMAKKALLDQLSTHPLLETSKSTPPSSYVNRSALDVAIPDTLDMSYDWMKQKTYTSSKKNQQTQKTLSSLDTVVNSNVAGLQSSFYHQSHSITKEIPGITKSIWSANQSPNTFWCLTSNNAPPLPEVEQGLFDNITKNADDSWQQEDEQLKTHYYFSTPTSPINMIDYRFDQHLQQRQHYDHPSTNNNDLYTKQNLFSRYQTQYRNDTKPNLSSRAVSLIGSLTPSYSSTTYKKHSSARTLNPLFYETTIETSSSSPYPL